MTKYDITPSTVKDSYSVIQKDKWLWILMKQGFVSMWVSNVCMWQNYWMLWPSPYDTVLIFAFSSAQLNPSIMRFSLWHILIPTEDCFLVCVCYNLQCLFSSTLRILRILTTALIFGLQTKPFLSEVSQSWHHWYFKPDNSLLCSVILCTLRC